MRTREHPGRDPGIDELEAALHGDGRGPAAEAWRALREDVRALAPPIDPGFERRLRERLAEPDRPSRRPVGRASAGGAHRRLPRPGRWVREPRLLAGVLGALAALAIGIVIAGPFSGTRNGEPDAQIAAQQAAEPLARKHSSQVPASPSNTAKATSGAVQTIGGAIPPSGRLQQLSASITLAPSPGELQSVADGVGRLAAREGGFVQTSQVNVQSGGGEAALQLSIPSARLSAALTALGRLAPVRAESRALQDITSSYESAKRRLADAAGARAALLRALANATTQAQIESLRRQLSLASGAIDRARSNLQTVSRSARSSSLEVSLLGDGHGADAGLTLDRGLHDAGRVLTVALIVVLIGLAVLVPLLVIVSALGLVARRARRVLRERALEGP
jgi:Domain of unknown function (DUF4349)